MRAPSSTLLKLARVFVFSLVLMVPFGTQAAGLFSTDPIFPTECNCDNQQGPDGQALTTAPDYGCVLQTLQNVINFVISVGLLLAVFYFAYAGVRLILSPTNPKVLSDAKNQILNALVGTVVVLCAWLIVDFVMKSFYDGDQSGFGPWNAILADTGNHKCVVARNPVAITTDAVDIATEAPSSSASVGYSSKLGVGSGSCSPASIQSAAAQGGYTLSVAEANTFSCLAIHESACGKNTSIPTTVQGAQTSARGMFQITLGANDKCHSLNLPVCTQAAQKVGWSGSGNLNCSQAFRGGRVKAGQEALARACTAAAQNLSCNASAAACLMNTRPAGSKFNDWLADSRASKQAQCVAKYNI